jgi:hypothetical protein
MTYTWVGRFCHKEPKQLISALFATFMCVVQTYSQIVHTRVANLFCLVFVNHYHIHVLSTCVCGELSSKMCFVYTCL